jgi:hypothetical protein
VFRAFDYLHFLSNQFKLKIVILEKGIAKNLVNSQATDRQREDGYVFQVMEQTMSKMYYASD